MKTKLSTRRMFLTFAQVAGVGAIGLLAGCASYPESHVVSGPPPAPPTAAPTVYTVPAAAPAAYPAYPAAYPAAAYPAGTAVAVPSPVGASSVIVMQAPPQAQQEIPSPRPSRDHAWVPGFWTWRNSRYEWMAGHWEVPPRMGAVWIPPRWQPEGNSWRFYEGYWD